MRTVLRRIYRALLTAHGRRRLRRLLKTGAMQVRLALGGGKFSYALSNGVRFIVYREDRLSQEMYLGGGYEPTETAILARILKAGDVMFDVGANIGYYSVLGARRVGGGGRVYAFEPGPSTHARLLTTLDELRCGNVVPVAAALSDSDGIAQFRASLAGRDAQQGFERQPGLEGDVEVVSVPTLRMDMFVAGLDDDHRRRLKLVKCDVEGAELLVLRGAERVLQSTEPPYWLLEYNKQALSQASVSQADILSQFAGCAVYYVPLAWPPSRTGTTARRLDSFEAPLPDECNLFIVPAVRGDDPELAELSRLGILPDHRCGADA